MIALQHLNPNIAPAVCWALFSVLSLFVYLIIVTELWIWQHNYSHFTDEQSKEQLGSYS